MALADARSDTAFTRKGQRGYALDPAFAPSTGTPVWGGLASWQAAACLRDLAGINLVGGDVVEVSPPDDTTGATAIAGAHVGYEPVCLYHWARSQI